MYPGPATFWPTIWQSGLQRVKSLGANQQSPPIPAAIDISAFESNEIIIPRANQGQEQGGIKWKWQCRLRLRN